MAKLDFTPLFRSSVGFDRLPGLRCPWARGDARYEKGELTIRVPKPANMQRQARRIEVRTV